MCMCKDLEGKKMIDSKEVEILVIEIYRKLSFYQHIKSICKKTGQKPGGLLRISPYFKDKKESYL